MNCPSSNPVREKKKNGSYLIGAVILLLVIVIPLSLYGLIDYLISPTARWPTEQFNSISWKSAEFKRRYVYYKDLRRRSLLDGATREKVLDLLGNPDYAAPGDLYYIYVLKHREDYEISLNSVYALRIDFSEYNRVLSYGIRAD